MRRVDTVVGWVIAIASIAFVALLSGFGSNVLTDDPPEVSPYAAGGASSDDTALATTDAGRLVVSEVGFTDGGWVSITNVGGTPIGTAGHWLCNRPAYFELPDITLGPGESLLVAATTADGGVAAVASGRGAEVVDASGSIGGITDAGGEMGLYTSSSFSDPTAIVSYVEWGGPDHGRSGTAVDAGIWVDGGFVDSGGANAITASVTVPTGPADWTVGG